MNYANFLKAFAKHISDKNFYMCCTLKGDAYNYIGGEDLYKDLLRLLTHNQHHVARLEEAIDDAIEQQHGNPRERAICTLSETLGYRENNGVEGRQNWLRELAREARITDKEVA